MCKSLTLNNNVKIPKIGYGVYGINQNITEKCVINALKVGYRHIDTSVYYQNEYEVGCAIKKSKIPREKIFITTKIYGAKNYNEACKMIENALKKLQVDYIDLLLIHWPSGDNLAMYKAMEDYYKKGKLKAIGLSNFYEKDLENIINNCEIIPVVDQLETHVFRNQKLMKDLLEKNNILLEAWLPLASGTNNIFKNEILSEIGKKYNKTNAQIALRYLYQQNILIIPRTVNLDRMKENINIEDFILTDDDIIEIEKLNKDKSLFGWY